MIALKLSKIHKSFGPTVALDGVDLPGQVGSVAIQALTARGYSVTALTGKAHEADYLRALGATNVLTRDALEMGSRPLEKSMWAGAVDPVGG